MRIGILIIAFMVPLVWYTPSAFAIIAAVVALLLAMAADRFIDRFIRLYRRNR